MEKIDFLWFIVKVVNYFGIFDFEIIREKLKFLKDKKFWVFGLFLIYFIFVIRDDDGKF